MRDYPPHGDYSIALDPEHDRVVRLSASGSVNVEMLRIHNDSTNAIVDGFGGQPYGMVCNFNGGVIMTPEAEQAWIRGAAGRVARGWCAVAYYFDDTADYKTLVRARITSVLDEIGVPWFEAEDAAEALSWVLERIGNATRS
ncbi:hypothetical protein [Nisaea sp.]|uniref:hypothetical protein n=1 Tax=Nisaea sp. TaxID=2024842 RepID=UPI003B528D23